MSSTAENPERPPVDLRSLITSPLVDQGARPLCVAISLSYAHEAAIAGSESNDRPMAPEAIWWYCTKAGQVGPGGMLLRHAGDALADAGQPSLTRWPWNPTLGPLSEDPPGTASPPPEWCMGMLEAVPLAHDGVENAIEDRLAAGQPVVLVIEVTDQFVYPQPDGSVAVPDIRIPTGDYHAVTVVGAASTEEGGRRLLIRNSWGEHWGMGGFAWLPLDYLIAYASAAAAVHE